MSVMGLYIQTNHELQLLLREKDAQLAECRQVLKEVEWQGDEFGERCASCGGRDLPNDADSQRWAKTLQSRCGHAPECRLAKALKEKP